MKRIISFLLVAILVLSMIPVAALAASVTITQQPQSVTVANGDKASVTVKASGTGLTYQWYYKDAGATDFKLTTAFKSHTYSVVMTDARAGRQVYCVITDGNGNSVQSNTATLNKGTALKITSQPTSVMVAKGAKASATVKAQGDGLTYKWYYKDAGATGFKHTTAFKTGTYSVEMTDARAGRQIYCIVTDKYGSSVQSATVTLDMISSLAITQQPVSVSVAPGAQATVTVKASGNGLTYKWYYKNVGDSGFAYTKTFTTGTYSVQMNASRAGRQVYCVITDGNGNSVRSNTVTLNMTTSLAITQQPQSVTVAKGETAKVSFTATGEGLTYTWYYKNKSASSFIRTGTFSGNIYTAEMNATRDGRQIYCVVKDKYGNSVKTNIVTLSMSHSSLAITQQPQSVTVAKGETAKVSFTATGEGLTYTWYYKNKSASSFLKTNTFTGNTYTAEMNATRDGRQIYCVVKDKYGNSVKTNIVTINMKLTALTVTGQPADALGKPDTTVQFTAAVTGGTAPYTYQWQYCSLADGEEVYDLVDDGMFAGATADTLNVSLNEFVYELMLSMETVFRCVITDAAGTTVTTDWAHIQPGELILSYLSYGYADIGEIYTAKVVAYGVDLTYQWYYMDRGESVFTLDESVTGNTYSVTMTEALMGRQIYCVVTDRFGNSDLTKTVFLQAKALDLETISGVQEAEVGDQVTFVLKASGGIAPYTYQWQYSYEDIEGRTDYVDFDSSGSWYSGGKADRLTVDVSDSTIKNGYRFFCIVTDAAGQTASTGGYVHVYLPFRFVQQPQNAYADNGHQVTFSVEVEGSPTDEYTYTWEYSTDGVEYRPVHSNYAWVEKMSDGTLIVIADEFYNILDRFMFRCKVAPGFSTDYIISDTVMIRPALKITDQPQDVHCEWGDDISFSVAVTGGEAPYTYQWQYTYDAMSAYSDLVYDWASGANTDTLSLMVETADFDDHFSYRCVITDAAGNLVVSESASPLEWLNFRTQPEDIYCLEGDTVSFSVVVAGGAGSYTYQWQYRYDGMSAYRDIAGTWASGANTDTLTFNVQSVDFDSNYSYRCVVTDATGDQVTSSPASPLQALHIVTQPVDVTCEAGDTVRFRVAVAGGTGSYSYKWQYMTDSSNAYESIIANWASGTTTDTLVAKVASIDFETHFRYRCIITDEAGHQVISESVRPVPKALRITTQPVSKTAAQDTTATFSVAVAGGSGSYTYQWQQMPEWNTEWADMSGRTSSTLSVSVTVYHVEYQYRYRCIITDSLGNTITSYIVTLN